MKIINSFGYILAITTMGMTIMADAATVRVTGGAWYLGNKLTATNFILGSAAALSGNGEVRAPAILAGTVSPGNGTADIGTLSFSDRAEFNSGSFVCYAATDTSLDRINATGDVTGAATVQMTRAAGASPLRQIIIKGGAASDYTTFGVSPSSEWVLDEANALDLIVSLGQLSPAPQNVVASDGTYVFKVALTWSAASEATGYQVWRNTVNNSSSATLLGMAAQTGYNDLSSAVGVRYYYWVKATNALGAGAFSSSDSGWRASIRGDYDGDGKADLAVYRDGYWSIYSLANGIILNNEGVWGGPNSITVPGDYDGDGQSDLAVYRDGYWSIYSLANGIILNNEGVLGGPGWTPVPGDYDGDGQSDLTVYSDGYWSIFSLANGIILNNEGVWGGAGWTPVAGDYDGDGQSDLAVYRDGYWSIYSLASGIILNNEGVWGGPSWITVSGDYDGDGKADLTVYHDGYWSIFTMAGSVLLYNEGVWGGPGWTPVPGDYDGDGKSDLAVYRDGYWSIYLMAGSVLLDNAGVWGGPGWTPVH